MKFFFLTLFFYYTEGQCTLMRVKGQFVWVASLQHVGSWHRTQVHIKISPVPFLKVHVLLPFGDKRPTGSNRIVWYLRLQSYMQQKQTVPGIFHRMVNSKSYCFLGSFFYSSQIIHTRYIALINLKKQTKMFAFKTAKHITNILNSTCHILKQLCSRQARSPCLVWDPCNFPCVDLNKLQLDDCLLSISLLRP